MGFRFHKQIGPKGFKLNIGKRGISSASVKIAPGVTLNSKRGATVGIPGTGISYNTGGRKSASRKNQFQNNPNQTSNPSMLSNEYTVGWRAYTGGYSKKAMIAVGICLLLCVTPLWPLPLLPLIPALVWLIIDTLIKIFRYNRYLSLNSRIDPHE